ncbi:nucleotidyltransferase family protein [Alteromonadaceae bacterium M269]|nr:nucleotidyltransferase family protein [Alteromonadaceae bacterium M269]
MILAAGRGQRMSPLTDTKPKPMIEVAGKPLIAYHLERLASLNIRHVVINHAWLGEQICQYVGDGSQWGLNVSFSSEAPALETAGGIAKALPELGSEPFIVINADIWTDFDLDILAKTELRQEDKAHLILVDNPEHHPKGDFSLANGRVLEFKDGESYTFSGMAIYRREFFESVPVRPEPLAPWLKHWIAEGKVSGKHYQGKWCDVGTPQRLNTLNEELS